MDKNANDNKYINNSDDEKLIAEGNEKEGVKEDKEKSENLNKTEKKEDKEVDENFNKIKELEDNLDQTTTALKRALSDYQNFKKRVEDEKQEASFMASNIILSNLLDVLDDFELVLKNIPEDQKSNHWFEGLGMIFDKLKVSLFSQQIEQLEIKEGDIYNPSFEEVIGTVAGENNNTIAQVVRNGYKRGEKIIRPARVIVIKSA